MSRMLRCDLKTCGKEVQQDSNAATEYLTLVRETAGFHFCSAAHVIEYLRRVMCDRLINIDLGQLAWRWVGAAEGKPGEETRSWAASGWTLPPGLEADLLRAVLVGEGIDPDPRWEGDAPKAQAAHVLHTYMASVTPAYRDLWTLKPGDHLIIRRAGEPGEYELTVGAPQEVRLITVPVDDGWTPLPKGSRGEGLPPDPDMEVRRDSHNGDLTSREVIGYTERDA